MFISNRNIIYLAILAMLSGCVAVAKGEPEGTLVNDDHANLHCELERVKQKTELTNPLAIDFNVDGSGSMLGYINQENSSYIQALKLLDSTLGLSGSRSKATVKYYRSGDHQHQAKELTRSEFNKAHKSEFYDGKKSNFPAVSSDLGSLITKPKNSDRLTVIVTDLDQNDGDVNLIANKIKENYFNNQAENYAVGIWAVKSEFNGTVYSASDADKKFNYNTEGKTSKQYRPFYVLFLGHHQDIANYFDKLAKEQGDLSDRSQFLIFSPHNLVADVSYLNSPLNLSSDLAAPNLLHNGDVSVEKNNQPIELLEIKNKNTDSLEIKYQLPLKQINHTLSADPHDLKIATNVSAFDKFNKQQFKQAPAAEKALNFKDWQINDNQIEFTTSINPNNFPESNIYYFAVDVVAKDLQKPEWWSEWNLNSGSDGSKTSNLYGFMNSLKNITLNSMDESTLTIGRLCYAIQKD
ncbi:MAG: hypothetical protein KME09_04240 [Pleurocapsa minor HA4230-MV1]|jgi:hypothetical protein|nr:hypothetical protein [Pleurocapsa minor HA4230-MV1]